MPYCGGYSTLPTTTLPKCNDDPLPTTEQGTGPEEPKAFYQADLAPWLTIVPYSLTLLAPSLPFVWQFEFSARTKHVESLRPLRLSP